MTTTNDKPKSDMALVREYFGVKLPEMKALTQAPGGKEAIKQMGEGIRNGSLTY